MDDLRVHIAMNDDDIAKGMKPLQAVINKKSSAASGITFVCTALIVGLIFFFLGNTGFYKSLEPAVIGIAAAYITLIIFVITWSVILKFKPCKIASDNGSLQRPKDIVINSEGVLQSSDKDTTFFKWSAILGVREDTHTILLFVDTASAFFIPKRFFDNEAAAQQFYNQASAYWSAAHPISPWGHVKDSKEDPDEAQNAHNLPFFKAYIHNLVCGFRQAVFVPSKKPFIATGHTFLAILATFLITQGGLEFFTYGDGGGLTYYWYIYTLCLGTLALLIAYIISSHIYKNNRILDSALRFLNSLYFLFIPYAAIRAFYPDAFYADDAQDGIVALAVIWTFAQLMSQDHKNAAAQSFLKPALAGICGAALVYAFLTHVHFNQVYYVYSDDEDAETSILDQLTDEELFSVQGDLREQALRSIKPSKAGKTDIFALTLAPYGYQDIFMREVNYVGTRLQRKLGITNIIPMISNAETVKTTALANTSNLNAYLQKLSKDYMQPDEDIALIFMTSHGDAKSGLSVGLGYDFSQLGMTPERVKKILDDSGIQNKIIIISACHSGTFIPPLQDDNTMIITAAATDRTSFGCSDEFDLTYFTEAYFKVGLEETTDLEEAFDFAKAEIARREATQNITPASNPQIFVGAKIKDTLRKYKTAPLAAKKKKEAPRD